MNEYIINGVEILLIYLGLLIVYKFVKGSSGDSALRGVAILFTVMLVGIYFLAESFGLYRIEKLLEKVVDYLFIAVIVVFQPELRRGLSRLGENRAFTLLTMAPRREDAIPRIVESVFRLARAKTGALIAIERGVGLRNYVERAVSLDAELTVELLDTIFYPGSALHDGAVIVRESRVIAAGCLFPLTENPDISKRLGTRHRAGIGLSEDTDALVIVVSEETGKVSVALKGELTEDLPRDQLARILTDNVGGSFANASVKAAPAGQA